MNKFKFVAGIATLAALIATPVLAADLSRRPVYTKAPPSPPVVAPSWAGFYGGSNGGFGWNKDTGTPQCITSAGVVGGSQCFDFGGLNNVLKPSGGLFGGQIGYNLQNGIVVYGLESDIQWSDIKDDVSGSGTTCLINIACVAPAFPIPFDFTVSQKLDWFGTFRGRIGITPWSQNALIYVTGGLIYGEEVVSGSMLAIRPGGFTQSFAASERSTRTGGTVGAGLEYLFTPLLSGKIEGLWYNMGSLTTNAPVLPPNGFSGGMTHNFEGGIVRAGLNYHFR